MLGRIKTVLGIEDTLQDEVLDILISNVENHLIGLIDDEEVTKVPAGLSYVVEEITIRRYNRIGTEGMQSESVEGHSVTYYDLKDEFTPYLTIIFSYKEPPTKAGRGTVYFI